jgi:nitrate/nitrite transporter NarK
MTMSATPLTTGRRVAVMTALVLSGEIIFTLPFVVARIFRPTFLDVFGLTNFQLGSAFSLYGIVAMLAYFPGGPLADRFSARRLMAAALLATSIGGIFFGFIPSLRVLAVLYAFWGLTTILLYWAALIRATREWGGVRHQGRAYGLLDGGRGLTAAVLASVTVGVFAWLLPEDVDSASLSQRAEALGIVIWIFASLTAATAVLVWLAVPDSATVLPTERRMRQTLVGLRSVLRMRRVWLQALIVICAYVAYKGTDDFSLYASDAFGYDEVSAARVAAISFWVRPVAAVAAGFLGDRIGPSRAIFLSFGILMTGGAIISLGMIQPGVYAMLIIVVVGTSAGIYALRGLYFAVFNEARIPLSLTGTAVGLVSVIGYTPDVFMGPLMGYLIDRSPGSAGHEHVFAVITGFALIGLVATALFRWDCARSDPDRGT